MSSKHLVESIIKRKKENGTVNPQMKSMLKGENKELRDIPLNLLKTNPYQPRIEIKEDEVRDLANSIKEKGLLQPILVAKADEQSYYIIAGHRRTEAYKLLNKKTIKARVITADKENLASLSIIENLQREDLDIIETAMALKRYKEEFNKTLDEIAKEIGKTKSYVSQVLNILNLPDEIIDDIRKNKSTKDIFALNLLNSYAKKKMKKFNTLNIKENADNIGVSENLEKIKKEILELYKGFLEKGREWLKREIKNRTSNKEEKKEVIIKGNRGGVNISIKRKLTEEQIKKLEEFLKELLNS